LKIRDARIKQLQDQVKQKEQAETKLENAMKVVNKNDKNLISKLAKSICFGQVAVYE